MLLVEATINDTLHRISAEGIALDHYWDNRVISFDPPQYQLANLYGGYVRPGFGDIEFSHDLFADDWPPPVNMEITTYYTATDEDAMERLFSGTGHIKRMTRDGIVYELFGPSYESIIVYNEHYQIGGMGGDTYMIGGMGSDEYRLGPGEAVSFDDTLVNVATWFAHRFSLDIDTTYARSPSPDVIFSMTADQIAINLLSDICAFFTHLFYISGGTLYLIDMLADAGSETITEFDFFPSEYEYNVPVAIARTANYARPSSYYYGQDLSLGTEFVDTKEKVEAALDNIIAVLNKAGCALKMPFLGSVPTPGKKISWTDTSLGQDTDAYIRCRTIRYDFDNEEVIIEGEGELEAA